MNKLFLFGAGIFFLILFVIGEYFYLNNKFSPVVVKVSKKEKKIEDHPTVTPTINDIKGVTIEITSSPTSTVTPSLNIQQVQNYLNTIASIRPSWKSKKDMISNEDFSFLMDSFDRQTSFCQTIIDHLRKNPTPSDEDLILWEGVQKMWGETGELTIKLNKELTQ